MATSKEEYLKRYLAPARASEGKKKKKHLGLKAKRTNLKVVDLDADIGGPEAENSEDEDLLPAVTVLDDRPKAVQELEKFELTQKWKRIGDDEAHEENGLWAASKKNFKSSRHRRRHDSCSDSGNSSAAAESEASLDLSPKRDNNRQEIRDSDSEEASTSRQHSLKDVEVSKSARSKEQRRKIKREIESPDSRGANVDLSPPRRRRRHSLDQDLSPPRRSGANNSDSEPARHKFDPKKVKKEPQMNEDLSPPRRRRQRSKSASPFDVAAGASFDLRKVKKEPAAHGDDDMSPSRNKSQSSKPTKTLSGAKAGLRLGRDLREEMDELRRREEALFESLPDEVSGRGAEARVREGIRPKKKKNEPTEEEKQKMKEMEEKYKKWNKGLKQLEKHQERVAEVLHEMDKPVARYKDDTDMNEMLKEQELREDPMFEYMQKKKSKKAVAEGKTIYPKYSGPMPAPNRYGIMPGYRWDGVDRSNGFETKLMSQTNLRKADDDEYYKWVAGTYE